MLVNNKPFSKYNHVDHKAIDFYLSFFFRHKSVILFCCINTQEANKESSEHNHPVICGNLVNVFQEEQCQIIHLDLIL